MTSEPKTRPRMPGPVMTAAILLGIEGGLSGLFAVLLGVIYAWMLTRAGESIPGLLVVLVAGLTAAMLAIVGLVGISRRKRSGQIITVVFGGLTALSGLYGLARGSANSLLSLSIGAAMAILVAAPVSARNWFAR